MKPVQSCTGMRGSLENNKVIGFLSKSRSYKASIQCLVGPLTARQQHAIDMSLRWWADDGQNKASELTPLTKLPGSAHDCQTGVIVCT